MSQLSKAQLQEKLDKSPSSVRVTREFIERRIKDVSYHVLPNTTVTICSITLDNGFSVRGESACVDPANSNKDVGETIAYGNAFNALWPLFGFMMAELMHRAQIQNSELDFLNAVGEHDGE